MKIFNQKPSYNTWLIIFIVIHIIVWTLAPTLTRHTLPMDALEGGAWGQHLTFGYDKDPYLNAWLTHVALLIDGGSGWCVYFFSAICGAICFYAIWALSRCFISEGYALIAATILEGIQYYNVAAIDFDDNILQSVFWALLLLFFYKALKHNKLSDWICLGIAAGLGLMSKYFILVLFFACFLFMLFTRQGRRAFVSTGFYSAFIIFIIIIAPHLYWLTQNHYATIEYGILRVNQHMNAVNAWQFTLVQLQAMIPCLILFLALVIGKRKNALALHPPKCDAFDMAYILCMGIAPFIITIVAATALNLRLHSNWAYSITILWPLIVLLVFKPTLTAAKLGRYIALLFFLLILAGIIYATVELTKGHKKDGNFPAKQIATRLTQAWQDQHHTKLAYVTGARIISSIVAVYSPDAPSALFAYDQTQSPWVNMHDFYQKGALVIVNSNYSENAHLPAQTLQQIPCLGKIMELAIPYYYDAKHVKATVRFAFMHPHCNHLD